MQNAVDIAVSEQGVSTEFILTKISAIFKHNGFPFDELSLNHLFFKKSQKREKKEGEITIGNFGTGFLTTHLLSKKVEISGVYKKRSGAFTKLASVCLDRSGDEKNITRALKQYSLDRNVIENNTDTDYNLNNLENTVFSYIFTENSSGLHTGKRGIEDLKNALSFAILFISQIKKLKSVRVKNELDNTDEIYILNENAKINIGELEIQKVEHNNNATYIAIISDKTTSIAMQVDFINNNEIKLIAKHKQTPNLFKVFPLIGSENFAFPTIINSLEFEPTKEREGVILSGSEQLQTQIATNRQIISNVVVFYQNFIKIICTDKTYKWTCLYELANIETPENSKHLVDLEWYKLNVILPIRKTLLSMPIVEIENSINCIVLENALFPYIPYGREEDLLPFWDICFEFVGSKMPKKRDVLAWTKILSGNYEEWGKVKENTNLKYDLKRLLKDIEQIGTVAKLAENNFTNNINETIKWLNKVIAFVFEQEETEFFKTIKVIPNQLGQFKLMENLVSDHDTRIPDELKIILKELSNDDWREKLVHKDIVCELPITQKTGVNQISTTIDSIIEENKNHNIRRAVYQLIAFYSPEFTENENNEIWRKSIYQLAKDLDNSVPEIQPLLGLVPNIWKKADEWIFENLVKDIAFQKNVEKLRIKLNKETQIETITWLNNFISFYETKQKARFYSDKAIFPNQEGDFKEKNKLHFDKINYRELKNVLKEFGQNWYQILLDERITSVKNFEQESPLTIKSISNAIYEQVKDKNLNQSEKFKNAIYELVSFLPNADFSERKRLLSFSNSIYPDKIKKVENAVILTRLNSDFDFSLVNEWILKALVTELHEKNIDKLQKLNVQFEAKTKLETVKWLDDFISFVAGFENHKHKLLLENFAIIPNQNNNFKPLKSLQKDVNIPNDLKDIANANYIKHDWNDDLLHKQLPQCLNLFDEKSSSSIEDIASEIDNAVRDSEGTDKGNKNFVELINLLLQSETVNSKENEKLFQYFHSHKSILVLATLGEGKVRSDIFDILQNRQKLEVLAKLAKSDVSMEQLETFNDAIKLVGAENISVLVNQAKEEKEQENFHTRLGTLAEQIFKVELEKEGFEVERTGFGSDFKLKKSDFTCLVEIKSFVEGFENAVKMTSFQAKTAISSTNYVLCVFPKTTTLPSENDFRTKVRFVINITENLRNVVINANQLEQQRENAINQQIGLVFEKWEYKYKISKTIWEVGKNLSEFTNYLTTK